MNTPTVTELQVPLKPVESDPFIAALERPCSPRSPRR
jgi:hypothetical protein